MPLSLYNPATKQFNWTGIAIHVAFLQLLVISSLEAVAIYYVYTVGIAGLGIAIDSANHLWRQFINAHIQITPPEMGGNSSDMTYNVGQYPIQIVYFGLFIFSQFFQFILVWDAARVKNTMQVIAGAVFNILTFAYSGIQIWQTYKLLGCSVSIIDGFNNGNSRASYYAALALQSVTDQMCSVPANPPNSTSVSIPFTTVPNLIRPALPYEYAIFVIMFVFNAGGSFVAWKVYDVYGWVIYQVQGASTERRRIMRYYHSFILLLKVNIFFYVGIIIQYVTAYFFVTRHPIVCPSYWYPICDDLQLAGSIVSTSLSATKFVIITGVVLCMAAILYYSFGYYGTRLGNRSLMLSFLVLITMTTGALIYPLYQAFQTGFEMTRVWLTVFCCIQICLNVITFFLGVFLTGSINKGLRDMGPSMAPPNTQTLCCTLLMARYREVIWIMSLSARSIQSVYTPSTWRVQCALRIEFNLSSI
ncbi:uncharacterized protein BJ171DRAFT_638422 [Polychytrium aggregatum]|uniref:uncharacterized protein n=1 Tax=Polychytrium aggregatum TaxID=110093 RepID=UPI0022FE6564|nr:uncharacterized protein BJ171DRAFT_638422 [Polychytrium aggregatum]KAI9207638.1 hypothetical protein BJ171DRAFT_638422 [Polychytrium aggregatum]